ncbi:hypothetical protein B0172_04665 [Mycobacterium avium subsp. paratuberculosis]|nr:hypothetical protein B0172_04665 [Mycobacterium avium subsp. paratuberculosis]OVF00081.1 hypothetical protein B0173_04651 [Mycobacterium avium subsp. paratuberculosis]
MCPGQHFDRLGISGVTGDAAVIVAIGAHQIRQELGVPGIGFGPRHMVAVAVAGGRHRVDRIHLVIGRGERLDPQTTVGFDSNHDLVGLFGMAGQKLMELADAGKSLR